jgi:hypothetical protein
MRLRALGIGLAVAALVAVLAAAASGYFGHRTGGPLGGWNGAGVTWRAAAGETVSWAMPLPNNPTTTDILIDSITAVGVDGFEMLGVLVSTDGCADMPTIASTFPPPGVSTVAPQGAILVALSEPCALHVLFGVRRSQASAPGKIGGIRIQYHFGGASYEDVLHWTLEVREPGT